MTPQSMSEVIHALEGKGYIKRNPHPNHRRTLPATLTPKGRRVLGECEKAVAEYESSMLRGFTSEYRRELRGDGEGGRPQPGRRLPAWLGNNIEFQVA